MTKRDWILVETGGPHPGAVTDGGTLYCWKNHSWGQIEDGATQTPDKKETCAKDLAEDWKKANRSIPGRLPRTSLATGRRRKVAREALPHDRQALCLHL